MSKAHQSDTIYMNMAIDLAKKGIYTTRPNPAVGCVIVDFSDSIDGIIVGTGFHAKAGQPHAEVHALNQAGVLAKGATAYVTLEPCAHFGRTPPCAEALIKAGIGRVVVATTDPNPQVAGKGVALLKGADIQVDVGICEANARELNQGFLKVMAGGLPFVRLKIAASLDGRTAMASGESKWITGVAARADVQRLRALSGAIITGSGTVLADNPNLNVRQDIENIPLKSIPQPLTVVLDRRGRINTQRISSLAISKNKQVLIFSNSPKHEHTPQQHIKFHLYKSLTQVLKVLRDDHEVRDVLVEAGSTLATAFLQENLVDELIMYQAPILLGNTARPMLDMSIDRLADKHQFCITDHAMVGEDVCLRMAKLIE